MGTLRYFDLEKLKNKYNCDFLVETGTFKGDSVKYASSFSFKKIFSIEIYPKLALECHELFKDVANIQILNTSSTIGLELVSQELDGNCIFWLDAHFPGSDVGDTSYAEEQDDKINVPLIEELKIISQRENKYQDVILIDDLRLFEEVPPEAGVRSFDEHMVVIGQPEVKRTDVINFNLANTIQKLFPQKTVTKQWFHEGYLVLLPNNESSS
jgi:hypothetical protein